VVDDLERALSELAHAGMITAPQRPKEAWTWRPAGAGMRPGSAAELLDSLREERSGE
jgi:hypothetical protein